FRGTPGRFSVEYAIVRHDALEAISVAEDPVDHVPAVAGAQRALTVFIDKRIVLLGIVEALHQVLKRSAAPVAVDRVNKLLPVAGRSVKINHDHNVTVRSEELGIPAVCPLIAYWDLRPAVHNELHRIFL